MAVKITFTRRARKSIRKIKQSDRRIYESLGRRFEKLSEAPEPPDAKPLKGPMLLYSIPFHGDYGRIIYWFVSDEEIEIFLVGTREEIYPQVKELTSGMV